MNAILSDRAEPAAHRLEVLSCFLNAGQVRKTPILFIHGAFAGAWCWAEHFLPFFARHGYAAYAVSLRGHGASEGREQLLGASLRDYVTDVETVIRELGKVPILVGHSMGGMVVQKYLERRSAPAAVLMASAPPEGLLFASWWLAFTNPCLFFELNLMALGGPVSLAGTRRAILSPDVPDEKVARCLLRLQQESQRVMADMHGLDLPRRNVKNQPPTLVLGGERDALVPTAAIRSTARAFGTKPAIFPKLAHAMMLDTGWERVATHILGWLDEQAL